MSDNTKKEINKAVSKLDIDLVKKSLTLDYGDISGTDQEVIKKFENAVELTGIKEFMRSMDNTQMDSAVQSLSLTLDDETQKRNVLETTIQELGLDAFFKRCDKPILMKFCENLGLQETKEKNDMEEQLADEVILTGMKAFLNKLPLSILKSYCKRFELKTKGAKTQLVESLMVFIFELEPLGEAAGQASTNGDEASTPSKKEKEKKEIKTEAQEKETNEKAATPSTPQKNAPRPSISTIVKGMTYTQMFDTFNLTDLVQYCKEKNMKSTGKKPVVIKRILQYLESGTLEAPTPLGKKKRKFHKGKSPEAKAQKKEDQTEEDEKEKEEKEKEEKEDEEEKDEEDKSS